MTASERRLRKIEMVAAAKMVCSCEVLVLLDAMTAFGRRRGQQEIVDYIEAWAIPLRAGDMAALDRRIAEWQKENHEV